MTTTVILIALLIGVVYLWIISVGRALEAREDDTFEDS